MTTNLTSRFILVLSLCLLGCIRPDTHVPGGGEGRGESGYALDADKKLLGELVDHDLYFLPRHQAVGVLDPNTGLKYDYYPCGYPGSDSSSPCQITNRFIDAGCSMPLMTAWMPPHKSGKGVIWVAKTGRVLQIKRIQPIAIAYYIWESERCEKSSLTEVAFPQSSFTDITEKFLQSPIPLPLTFHYGITPTQ